MFDITDTSFFPTTSTDEHSNLLPPIELVSPTSPIGSGSSGPPSPHQGPFTPTTNPLANTFAELTMSNSTLSMGDLGVNPDMGLEFQFQQNFENFDPYSWANSSSLWASSAEITIGTDDFDLESIPPAQFGFSK